MKARLKKLETVAVLFFSAVVLAPAQTPEGKTVQVTLTEWKIDMPTSLPAGVTTFKITNGGKHQHTVEIKGEGTKQELPHKLKTGESSDLTVDLKPGTYRVYCPIGFGPVGHASRGMDVKLTVTARNP